MLVLGQQISAAFSSSKSCVSSAFAQFFDDLPDLGGVVLTKMYGDVRTVDALSIKAVTGKPLTFIGVDEKTG